MDDLIWCSECGRHLEYWYAGDAFRCPVGCFPWQMSAESLIVFTLLAPPCSSWPSKVVDRYMIHLTEVARRGGTA